MNTHITNKSIAEIVGDRSASSPRVNNTSITLADFAKWWKSIEPIHKGMILAGIFVALAGLLDLILYLIIKFSIAFWANDILLIFGGFILIQIGLSYAIRSLK